MGVLEQLNYYLLLKFNVDEREIVNALVALGFGASLISIFARLGGGVPKNFIQDTVVCAELLGKKVDMHKYAVQITVADTRDGACSSSTLKEASSWGKVDVSKEQMVFAEATSVLPLIASDAYHRKNWKERQPKNFSNIFD